MSDTLARLIDVAVTPTSVLPPLFAEVAAHVWPGPAGPPVVDVVPFDPAVPLVPAVPPVVVVVPVVEPVPVDVCGPVLVVVFTPAPPPPCWIARARSCADSRAPQPAVNATAPRNATR